MPQVQFKNDASKALVTFLNKQDAINAMNSPDLIFGNVLIKKSFYTSSQLQAPTAVSTITTPQSHVESNQDAPRSIQIQMPKVFFFFNFLIILLSWLIPKKNIFFPRKKSCPPRRSLLCLKSKLRPQFPLIQEVIQHLPIFCYRMSQEH